MLKKGDFVKIKPNTSLESGETINNWAGEVQEVYQEENCCLITFDAQTIDSLDDSFLQGCIEEGAEGYEYVFNFSDLEIAPRRDTDEQMRKALDDLATRMIKLEGDEESEAKELTNNWIDEFSQSQYFFNLSEYQKENSNFIIDTFIEYMFNYEYVTPNKWTPNNVEEVCLNVVPRKISSEIELFENYGVVLQHFVRFLKEKEYINNADKILKTLISITPKISIEASNSGNWGMAKSLMMGAKDSGIDFGDEEELQRFIMNKNLEIVARNRQDTMPIAKHDPFKGIGRNQKVSVKYENGKILENIKFKKVEQDLRNGKCVISKK